MKRCWVLLFAGLAMALCAAELTLSENGAAKAVIVIPEEAKPIVRFAAKELAEHLRLVTGAEYPITSQAGEGVSICLGFGEAEGFGQDEYVIEAKGSRIDIYGKDTPMKVQFFNYFYDNPDKGTLRGVYNFLDSLGVRWLAPGKENVYAPEKKTLRVPEQSLHVKPHFQDRGITDAWNFTKVYPDAKEYVESPDGLFLWGIRNNVSTRNMVNGCHSERSLKLFENPDWLAHPTAHQLEKGGKRNPNYSCWTDPYTREVWLRAADGYFSGKTPQECGFDIKGYLHSTWPNPFIAPDEFMIDPMDHGSQNDGRCYCGRCQAFREKHPCEDDTEIVWQVIADVARQMGEKYPGRYISTLVYPPKRGIPKSVALPKNLRVRICLPGPREMLFPELLAKNSGQLKAWGDFLGARNIPLWTYQCSCSFGRNLPGVLDSYPHLIARYIQHIRPLCAGMHLENHNLTHTYRNMDVYIYLRLMWNPDRDVEKELEEYFRLYYGPAAQPARELFALFEKDWCAIDRQILYEDGKNIGVASSNKEKNQKRVWSEIYTLEEMGRIDALMGRIRQLAPEGTLYAKRAALLDQYLVQVMKAERSEVMDKEEKRRLINLHVAPVAAEEFPTDEQWSRAAEHKLISAERMTPGLQANGSFRILASRERLFLRATLEEPLIADSKTDKSHQTGNNEIWRDNCIELFFYSEKDSRFWQVIVNDRGAWCSQTKGRVLLHWVLMEGLLARCSQTEGGWTAELSIPLKELEPDTKGLRFNLTRERNVNGGKAEFSTWSPLAMLGNWHGVENYGTLIFDEK